MLGDKNTVTKITVTSRVGGDGISVGTRTTVSQNIVSESGGDEIVADTGSTIKNNTANDNTGNGISTGAGALSPRTPPTARGRARRSGSWRSSGGTGLK